MSQVILNKETSPVFGYTGEVSTKVIKNNRVLKSSVGTNNGLPSLFSALCYALADDSRTTAMPARLILFSYTEDSLWNTAQLSGLTAPEDEEEETLRNFLQENWNKLSLSALNTALTALTSPLIYSAPPEVYLKATDTPAVKFSYKIPYSVIKDPYGIRLAVLFPNKPNGTINLSDALAYYFLRTEDTAPPEGKENAYFLLDWSMSFENAKGDT